jgi:hypothetical protein
MHESQVNFVLAELVYYADTRPDISPVDGVYQSDSVIPEKLRAELIQQLQPLENKRPIDYHPGSKDMVINLIHPSMYCFVSGVSRLVTEEVGQCTRNNTTHTHTTRTHNTHTHTTHTHTQCLFFKCVSCILGSSMGSIHWWW